MNFSEDCMPRFGARGERCVAGPDIEPTCVSMECSEEGTVLVAGEPCDPGARPHRLEHPVTWL